MYWNKIDVHNHLLAENLMEAQRKVSLAKKRYTQWLKYDWSLGLFFIAWFIWEVYQKSQSENNHTFPILLIIGFLILLPFSIRGIIRTRRHYQKILDQIDELTSNVE